MFFWLLAAALFNVFYKPARQGRKVAYLTVVSFVFLAIALGVLLLVHNEHGQKPAHGDKPTARIASILDLPLNDGSNQLFAARMARSAGGRA
jgi:hypothetical protein